MNDIAESIPFDLFDRNMHMVRHDNPRDKTVALAIKVFEGRLHDACVRGLGEQARPSTLVDHCFEARPAFRFAFGGHSQCSIQLSGQAVAEPKRDRLNHGARVEMRKITATMPEPVRAIRTHRTSVAGRCRQRLPEVSAIVWCPLGPPARGTARILRARPGEGEEKMRPGRPRSQGTG